MPISEDIKHKQLLSSINKINKSLDNIDNAIKRLTTTLECLSSANISERDKNLRIKAIDYLYDLGCTTKELLAVGVLTEDDMVDESEED